MGHSWGEWKTTKEADCEHEGEQTRICTRDASHTEKRATTALGHDFEDPQLVKKATLTETGLMQGKCKRCGKTTDQIIPCKAADAVTGIEITAEEGAFAAGTTLSVEKVEEASGNYENVKNALSEVSEKFSAYDIATMLNGTSADPAKPVTITLPVPNGFSDKIALYAIGQDGTATEIETSLSEDGKTINAQVSSLGRLALADLSVKSTDTPDTDIPQSGEPSTDEPMTDVPTSDTSDTSDQTEKDSFNYVPVIIIAVVVVLAIVAGIVIWLKKKK